MPIQVSCPCGKQLRVAEEHVGKRVRCPGCGEALTVKAGGDGAIKSAPAKKTEGPPAIEFACGECGKEMQARPEHAGKTTRCPACKAAVKIPASAADEPEELEAADEPSAKRGIKADKPTSKVKKPLPEDDDVAELESAEEEDDRPRKKKDKKPGKKGRKPVGLLVGMAIGLVILLAGGGFAGWYFFFKSKGSSDLAWVPADAQGFVTIQVGELWKTQLVRDAKAAAKESADVLAEMENKVGLKPEDVDRATLVIVDFKAEKAWFVVSTIKQYDRQKIVAATKAKTAELKYQDRAYQLGEKDGAIHFASDRMMVFAQSEAAMKAALDQIAKPKTTGKLEKALKAARGSHHVVAGFQVPPEAAQLGKNVGKGEGAKFAAILDAESAVLALNVTGNTIALEATGVYGNDAKAKEVQTALTAGKDMVKGLLTLGGGDAIGAENVAKAQKVLESLTIEQKGVDVVVKVKGDVGSGELAMLQGGLPFPGGVRGAATDAQSRNNLKQLALAFHNYADSNRGKMPADIVDKAGRPLLSWRVAILPYIEEQALYQQFKLDEPWNGPTNSRLWNRMPKTLAAPTQPSQINTYYKLFVGQDTLYPRPGVGPHLPASFRKGTSNMLLVVEAKTPSIWCKPEDVFFQKGPANPLFNLGIPGSKSTNAALADGSVRVLAPTLSAKTLQAVITANDDDVPGPDW